MTGEFPAQMASNAEIVSIWWRHHDRQLVSGWHAYVEEFDQMRGIGQWYIKQKFYKYSLGQGIILLYP